MNREDLWIELYDFIETINHIRCGECGITKSSFSTEEQFVDNLIADGWMFEGHPVCPSCSES